MAEMLERQAQIFSRYLIGGAANDSVIKLYKSALKNNKLNKEDQQLLDFIVRHPWSVGIIDAGLTIKNPYSDLRRRIYIMLAILEASPDYHSSFLAKKRSFMYVAYAFYSGCRAVVKTLVGLVFLKIAV